MKGGNIMIVYSVIAQAIREINREAYQTQTEKEYNATVDNLEILKAEYIDTFQTFPNFSPAQFASNCRGVS